MKVHSSVWKAWFSPAGKSMVDVEWREDMTLREFVPEHMRDLEGLRVLVNGWPSENLDFRPSPGDFVDVAVMPGGTLPLGWAIVVGTAGSFVLNKIIAWIIGAPKGPKERGDEKSPTSAWSGVQNIRTEGQPKKVVYGRFRVAPTNIDEFVVTTPSPPTSTLYTLGSIGEGPVNRIGDQAEDNNVGTPLSSDDPDNPIPKTIQVNGNSLESFRGVEAHVRMGSLDQEPIPGFELIVTDYEVGATLKQEESAAGNATLTLNPDLDLVSFPYFSDDPEPQALWDAYGFGYDLRQKADRFTCLVEFPSGLARVDSSGNLVNAGFQCVMRYIELDDQGDPIEVGGDNGDGYVYVRPEDMQIARTQNAFGREYSATFQDPASYVPGSVGRALLFDGVTGYATTDLGANDSILQMPASWAAGQNPTGATFMGWCQFDFLGATGGSNFRPIFEISGISNRGIALMLERVPHGDQPVYRWLPTVYIGTGSSTEVYQSVSSHPTHYIPFGNPTSWHHLAVTYNYANGISRITCYLNGLQIFVFQSSGSSTRWFASGRAYEMGRSRMFEAGQYSAMRVDEWKIRDRELTASEIGVEYSGGTGTYGVHVDGHIAGWHFDDSTSSTNMEDYGHYNGISSPNDLRLPNSGAVTGSQGSGRVSWPGSGPIKRSRYRVEMLRLNYMSSSEFTQDDSVWSVVQGKVSAQLAYPNQALLATKIKANDQLSGSRPTTTVLVEGMLCPVWDGNSTTNPHITYQWTRNPAWICLDIATNKRYGGGGTYDFFTVDLASVKDWADYCDELVYDNRGNRQQIDESGSEAIYDLRYDSTLFDGYGGIEIQFRTSPTVAVPPRRWVVGRHVGFSGIPPPAGAYDVDINSTNIPGFEIGAVTYSGGWTVTVKYDTATYGIPWTNGQQLSVVLAATLTGEVFGCEPRFEYSWVHDTFKGFWDTLVDVAATARAAPIPDGRILRFKVERPRTAVSLIGKGQIIPRSFEIDYAGSAKRANSITADYWDEDQNYDRVNVPMDDPELDPATLEEDIVRQSITVEGITRRSQMKRHIFWMLLVNRMLRRSGKFRTGLEALTYEAGDVVQLAHDIVPWGESGRLLASSTTTSVRLDRTVTLLPSTTYYLKVRGQRQVAAADGTITDQQSTVQVTQAAGTYSADDPITINTLGFVPAKDDPYVLYTEAQIRLVQIAKISLAEGLERSVEWVEYRAEVYDCDVLPEDLTV